jgi:hypothetical protein
MIAAPDRLTLLPFPQRWAGGSLHVRIVILPRGDPLAPLMTGVPGVGDGPAFADADLRLKAMLVSGLAGLPVPGAATAEVSLTPAPQPDRRALFEEIAGQFDIDPALEAATREQRRPGRQILKYVPDSYRESFPFGGPRTPFAVTDDAYWCALRNASRLAKPPPPLSTKTVWGRLIGQALRQPLLAERLSILDIQTFAPPMADVFATGGWLYLTLDTGSPYLDHVVAQPQLLASYAARIPPLGASDRVLFASVLFPVQAAPPTGDMDEIQTEAAGYDDGFARVVHSAQKTTSDPTGMNIAAAGAPIADTGIQLGWDDEQVLIWQNRQITDPTVETRNAPMGVKGYRVDVREHGDGAWSSLVRAESDLAVGPIPIGHFDAELAVEVASVQLDNEEDGNYWMPPFFSEWRGRSLVTGDEVALQLSGVSAAAAADTYQPVGADAVALRYGHSYDFRVRLADISGGGPPTSVEPVNPAPAPVTTCHFRRFVPPREVSVPGLPDPIDPTNPPVELHVDRPKLAYPAAVFAGIPNAPQRLLDDAEAIRASAAAGGRGGEPGLPDPDVATLRITLSVVGLEFDAGNDEAEPPLRQVYTAVRKFPANPANPLVLALDYVDAPDVAAIVPPATGALPVPTARDVVLTLTPVGREDANVDYFGSQDARIGRPFEVRLRRAPFEERNLFVPGTDQGRLRAILLQPDEAVTGTLVAKLQAGGRGVEAEHEPLDSLAAELDLHAEDAALSSRSAERVVFGCSAAIAHVMAPDRSVITFASKADVVGRWINVLTIAVARDWTWRNADRPGFEISRDGQPVGAIDLPASINPRVWEAADSAGREPERTFTRLVFLDAVDPKPVPPSFPSETSHVYSVTPRFRDAPGAQDPRLDIEIDLPIAVPPTQTPKLFSAGIALSPYIRANDYSSTEARDRMLWLEVAEPIENPADAYFARVLSYAPDPVLTRGETAEVPPEPPLPIEPESMRVIRPGQSDDRAGLGAMQLLIPTDSPRHFLVPLPPGLTRDSRELFGFFVMELRVGHLDGWSTARARFGPALRIAGLQHPAPALSCQAMRTPQRILVAAPHATPVFSGRNMVPRVPATELWFLLYAQVMQADGQDHRNILLARRRGRLAQREVRSRVETDLNASSAWVQAEVDAVLDAYELPAESPLSVLAVELIPELDPPDDPLGSDLGEVRILRASPLVKLDDVCVPNPTA